jgi:hypothetical protein
LMMVVRVASAASANKWKSVRKFMEEAHEQTCCNCCGCLSTSACRLPTFEAWSATTGISVFVCLFTCCVCDSFAEFFWKIVKLSAEVAPQVSSLTFVQYFWWICQCVFWHCGPQ